MLCAPALTQINDFETRFNLFAAPLSTVLQTLESSRMCSLPEKVSTFTSPSESSCRLLQGLPTDSDAGFLVDVHGLPPVAKHSADRFDSSLKNGLAPMTTPSLVLVKPVGEHMAVPPLPRDVLNPDPANVRSQPATLAAGGDGGIYLGQVSTIAAVRCAARAAGSPHACTHGEARGGRPRGAARSRRLGQGRAGPPGSASVRRTWSQQRRDGPDRPGRRLGWAGPARTGPPGDSELGPATPAQGSRRPGPTP